MWMAELKYLSHYLLPPWMHTGRKLEPEFDPKNSDTVYEHSKQVPELLHQMPTTCFHFQVGDVAHQ